jgi:plastocyanin
VAVLLLSAPAHAVGEVTLTPDGGEQQTVSLDAVPQALRVSDRPYTLRGGPQGDTTVTVSGVTLDRLLDHAGIDSFDFESVEIGAGDRAVVLDRDQLTDVDAFPEGRPIFWSDEQGTHFLRPSAGADDPNADDLLTAADGALRVTLRKSGELSVRATASRTQVRKGQAVTFTATVSGPGAEVAPVSWSFDDGRRGSGRQVTHRFTRPGTYEVAVSAGASADDVGVDDLLTIRVGKARSGGPNRMGGGTNTAADAPDSGAATGASGAGGPPAALPSPTPDAPPEPAPTPTPAPPQQPPAPVEPTTPELKDVADPPATTAIEQVEGVLLADASPEPTTAKAEALKAARTGTLKPPDDAASSIPPVVWGLLVALSLLGLGVWRERRSVPTRRSA